MGEATKRWMWYAVGCLLIVLGLSAILGYALGIDDLRPGGIGWGFGFVLVVVGSRAVLRGIHARRAHFRGPHAA